MVTIVDFGAFLRRRLKSTMVLKEFNISVFLLLSKHLTDHTITYKSVSYSFNNTSFIIFYPVQKLEWLAYYHNEHFALGVPIVEIEYKAVNDFQ